MAGYEELRVLPPEITSLAPNEQAAVSQFTRAVREKFGKTLVKALLYGSKARKMISLTAKVIEEGMPA